MRYRACQLCRKAKLGTLQEFRKRNAFLLSQIIRRFKVPRSEHQEHHEFAFLDERECLAFEDVLFAYRDSIYCTIGTVPRSNRVT